MHLIFLQQNRNASSYPLLARKPSQLEANKASHITTGYRYIVFVRATMHTGKHFIVYHHESVQETLPKRCSTSGRHKNELLKGLCYDCILPVYNLHVKIPEHILYYFVTCFCICVN